MNRGSLDTKKFRRMHVSVLKNEPKNFREFQQTDSKEETEVSLSHWKVFFARYLKLSAMCWYRELTPLLTGKSLFDEMIWKWLPEEVIVTTVRYFDLISFLVTLGQSWVRLDAINSEIMDVLFRLFFSLSYSPPKSIIMLLFRVQFFSALVTRQRKKYSFLFSYPF